jgi:hypothetical protein
MKKSLPEAMFNDPEKSRLTMLRAWVLDNDVTEIEMKERQFWNFAHLQPLAEKPWTTFMGRAISVPDMPLDAQKHLGVFRQANSRRHLVPRTQSSHRIAHVASRTSGSKAALESKRH